MAKMPWGRIILILFVLGLSGIILLNNPIMYGLDLQGGSHLLIKVHADEAVENEVDDAYAAIRSVFEENEIAFAEDRVVIDLDENAGYTKLRNHQETPPRIEFTLSNASQIEKAKELIRERINVTGGNWSMDNNGTSFRLTLSSMAIEIIRGATLDNVRRAIEHRINSLGVAEPSIVFQGDPEVAQRILLQLPGVEDPEEAKRRIQTPGNLEFRMVVYDDDGVPYQARTKEELLARLNDQIPTGTEMVPEYSQTKAEAQGSERLPKEWYLIYKDAPVNSNYLVDARRSTNERGQVVVTFNLNAEGGERMRRLTRPNVNKLMANVLDGEAIMVANIGEEIGSQGNISGNFTQSDADRLAYLLRTGAIPTSMHVEEERSVGPALGADSIRMSVQAFIWGLSIIAVFMVIYYKFSGILAVFVLTLNIVIIMAILAWFGAVLTLPGIAGIILTIGMSVDANVIIFERIREERKIGRSVLGSIDSGFGKAFGTIFDANITTLIAAIFLFQFGTGPIRGFATTITIGILASMFTAVFVARTVYDSAFALKNNKVSKLSI